MLDIRRNWQVINPEIDCLRFATRLVFMEPQSVSHVQIHLNRGDMIAAIKAADLVPENGADVIFWQEFKTIYALDQCLVPGINSSSTLIHQTTVQSLCQVCLLTLRVADVCELACLCVGSRFSHVQL